MTKQKKRNVLPIWLFFVIYGAVIASCIAIDQLTKYFIEKAVAADPDHRIRILGDWLTLVWTTNDGATGGMFSDLSWSNWLFFSMTLIGLPVFGWLLWRSRTRSVCGQIAFSFVTGGTIGNAIDRIVFAKDGFFTGSVRDFVQVQGFFGIFNIADSFLVVGVILAILAIVFFDSDSLLNTILTERRARAEAGQSAQTEQPKQSEQKQSDQPEQQEQLENDDNDIPIEHGKLSAEQDAEQPYEKD